MGRLMKVMLMVLSISVIMMGYATAQEKGVVTYENNVKPIIANGCLSCHGSNPSSKGLSMDTYQNLMVFVNGKDTGAFMRRLDDGKNTKDGKPGNMYKWLGKTDEERSKNLETIKNWIGGWTLKRKAEITEEELKTIKAKEK